MKVWSLLLATFVALPVFAADKDRMVCIEYNQSTRLIADKAKTLVVTQNGEGAYSEEQEAYVIPYVLTIYKGAEGYTDQVFKGTVLTEDVGFEFTSEDGKVVFNTYLDEMDQSSLTIEGKDMGMFICR